MYCVSCGAKLPEAARFCGECGTPRWTRQLAPPEADQPAFSPAPRHEPAAKPSEPVAHLTTRQVAAMCPDDVNESTVRYLARTGVLPGRKVGNRWQFQPSDAQTFCDRWHTRVASTRERSGTGSSVQRGLKRVLDGNGVSLLNLVASVASLVALAAGWLSLGVSLMLAVFNLVGAGVAWIWVRARRPTTEDVVDGEAVDPGAV
jgi:zinc-ribbon domain